MAMTIYLDVLLLSNLWADYALLRTAAALTHTPFRNIRLLLAAVLGALSSLAVFLPPLPLPLCLAGRILLAALLCGTAFGFRQFRPLLRLTGTLLGVSILFCGAVYLLAMLKTPDGWYLQNTFFYADISLMTLLLGTTAAAALTVIRSHRAAALPHRCYRLHLRLGTLDLMLPALADTGNTLRDAFSGKAVIVCGKEALSAWLRHFPDTETAAASAKGFRMIPVKTVAGTKLLPAFLPEYAALLGPRSRDEYALDILLALTDEPDTPAIVPACCIH